MGQNNDLQKQIQTDRNTLKKRIHKADISDHWK